MRRAVVLFAVLGCAPARVSAPAVAPAAYEIRVRRPSRVGERTAVVVDSTIDESNKTYTDQVLLKNEHTRAHLHLDAVAETREIDALGLPVRTDFTIRSFTKDGSALAAPGKHVVVVSAPAKKDARVEVDGSPAGDELREAVDDVVPIARAGDPDTIFGAHAAKRVGDAWSFDKGAMVHELARTGVLTKPSAVDGRVSLASVARVGGVDCVDLRIDLAVSEFAPAKPLPDGSEITRGRLTLRIDEELPVDARSPRRADETVVHAEFEAFVPVKDQAEVAGVTVERVTDRTRRATYTPL